MNECLVLVGIGKLLCGINLYVIQYRKISIISVSYGFGREGGSVCASAKHGGWGHSPSLEFESLLFLCNVYTINFDKPHPFLFTDES